jgi:hypothetical protein
VVGKSVIGKTVAGKTVLRSTAGLGLDALRRQSPLPETADEACRVARLAGATPADVIAGEGATESAIKALSASGRLADTRVVHFATHGLLAGETAAFLSSKAEPSLLLTPPETASEADDGLLTASEVSALRLDADWVVLSACNTASGDDVGAESLSGLARAFFYAGARSLLVSHWAVDSDATVKLVSATFEAMANEPGITQGKALSRAMKDLMAGGGREAHPSNWAPFIVVGGSPPIGRQQRPPLNVTAGSAGAVGSVSVTPVVGTPSAPPIPAAQPKIVPVQPPGVIAPGATAKPKELPAQPQAQTVPAQAAPGPTQPAAARSSRSRPAAAPQPERSLIDEGFGR